MAEEPATPQEKPLTGSVKSTPVGWQKSLINLINDAIPLNFWLLKRIADGATAGPHRPAHH